MRSITKAVSAGIAQTSCHVLMPATITSLRYARLVTGTPANARCMTMERKIIERLDRGHDRWIDVLETSEGEPLYRACGQGMCRYTNDLWQAEIYVQYY